MQHCKEEAEERLQDCFKSVDWATFKDSSVDLNEYATVVTDFIKTNVDECTLTKPFQEWPQPEILDEPGDSQSAEH